MNIDHPGRISDLEDKITAAAQKARIEVITAELHAAKRSLAAIFDCIARREQIDLTYDDGEIVTITRAKKRGEKDAGEE